MSFHVVKVSDKIQDIFKSLLTENIRNKDEDDFHDEDDTNSKKKLMMSTYEYFW